MDELEKVFRSGSVHSVNEKKGTARVKFDLFSGIISAELKIVWQNEKWLPQINDNVLCICPPGGDGDGYIVGRL